jgi:heterokaryon incompatibility protein (HET)
VGNPDSFG